MRDIPQSGSFAAEAKIKPIQTRFGIANGFAYLACMHPFILKSTNVTLAILAPESAAMVRDYHLANKAHLAPWEPARDDSYFELDNIRVRLQKSVDDFRAGVSYGFAIIHNDDQIMIGNVNFSNIVHGVFQACHLGYSISAKYEGQGLMHESLQTAIAYMFDVVGLHRIMANYMPRNDRSARVLERLGFEKEGYAKAYLKIAGVWEDHVLTALVNKNVE